MRRAARRHVDLYISHMYMHSSDMYVDERVSFHIL